MWTGVLGIALVEGQDLPQYGQGDIYVRFRLGDQKYKSKVWAVAELYFHPFSILLSPFSPFLTRTLYTPPFPHSPYLLAASPSQQVPVSDSPPPWLTGPWQKQLIKLGQAATHFSQCFGCWASLPSFAYPACSVHLPVLAGLLPPPPDDSPCTCLVLLCYFFCKPSSLSSPLVCLLDKADSNWKLSVFTIPVWLPSCARTSAAHKWRHIRTNAPLRLLSLFLPARYSMKTSSSCRAGAV